ncbi:hypothetical protein Tco_1358547 [Tanacetum coccineum]
MRLNNSQYGISMLSTYAVSMKITIRRYSKSSKLGMISKIYYERSAHSKESSPIRLERISKKRTKNKAKNDKTGHGME